MDKKLGQILWSFSHKKIQNVFYKVTPDMQIRQESELRISKDSKEIIDFISLVP